jgi:hypothetical protein
MGPADALPPHRNYQYAPLMCILLAPGCEINVVHVCKIDQLMEPTRGAIFTTTLRPRKYFVRQPVYLQSCAEGFEYGPW